ncbi:MAG: hypothetical protein KDC66_22845 [Phaeodactylibacter sp.]|nr:hypothetical protein [Phaeodactylibacter sp.]MCB9277180.1 hypothetical protein [Lewinellaceae bacterium]
MEGMDFEVSIISTVTAGKKMDGGFLEEWLNQNFRLADYGTGIEEMFILFHAEKQDKPPSYQYHPDEHFLELTIPLQEINLQNAGREATIIMMAVALAKAIRSIPEGMAGGFSLEAFREELEDRIE